MKGSGVYFPTQVLTGHIGVLCQGEYSLAESVSIGEGGLFYRSPKRKFEEGQPVVVTFRIPHFLHFEQEFFSQMGMISYVDPLPASKSGFHRVGQKVVAPVKVPVILFSEISPVLKKKIRDYLVSKGEQSKSAA